MFPFLLVHMKELFYNVSEVHINGGVLCGSIECEMCGVRHQLGGICFGAAYYLLNKPIKLFDTNKCVKLFFYLINNCECNRTETMAKPRCYNRIVCFSLFFCEIIIFNWAVKQNRRKKKKKQRKQRRKFLTLLHSCFYYIIMWYYSLLWFNFRLTKLKTQPSLSSSCRRLAVVLSPCRRVTVTESCVYAIVEGLVV